MDQSTSFAQPQAVLPPPPPFPAQTMFEQPLSNFSDTSSSKDPSPIYYRHVPQLASYEAGYAFIAGIPLLHKGNDDMLSFGYSDVSDLSNHSQQQPTEISQQEATTSNGFMARPTSMQSAFSQDTIHASPVTVAEALSPAMFSTVLTSPKRTADGSVGPLGNKSYQGSWKRQRLDLSVGTTLPFFGTGQHAQQSQFGGLISQGSTAMTAPMSASMGSLDVSVTADSLDRPGTNSTTMPDFQVLPMHPAYSSQMHDIPPSQFGLSPLAPGSNDIRSSNDSQLPGSFSGFQQHLPFQTAPYNHRFPSTASGMVVPGLPNSYGNLGIGEGFNSQYSMRQGIDPTMMLKEGVSGGSLLQPTHTLDGRFTLVVKQQPERARLCSFKEENDTIDRRPVDPPPIIQIIPSEGGSIGEMLVRHHLFMKAVLVAPHPDFTLGPPEMSPTRVYAPVYQELRLPAGQEATTGEATQTPEKLQDLEGKEGAFCVFGRLSIRMPGQFRLRFSLYEATNIGVREVAHVHSDPFEVFSPKLFGGMRQSTTLTRHFASQGLKIKLRQDGASRGGRRKKAPPLGQNGEIHQMLPDPRSLNTEDQKQESLSRLRQDSHVSPTSKSFTQVHSAVPLPPPPAHRALSSISSISSNLNPYRSYGGNFSNRYSMSSVAPPNKSSLVPSPAAFSPRSSAFDIPTSAGGSDSQDRPGATSHPAQHSSDDTVTTIDHSLDKQNAAVDLGKTGKREGPSTDPQYSSAGKVNAKKLKTSDEASSGVRNCMMLPSIDKAMQQSSVWLNNANLVPPDDMVSGGIMFRNGIRYGGDDGSMPPMSFGKLPSMIYEGILPGTPGISGGNDLSNFSLKNGSGNLALTPHPMISGSTPNTPGLPFNGDLTQYLNTDSSIGTRPSRAETSSGSDSASRSYHPPMTIQKSARRPDPSGRDAFGKPSQFADLDQNPDAASSQGLAGFSSALSSSLSIKNFNLSLPRRESRDSRGLRGSLDEQARRTH